MDDTTFSFYIYMCSGSEILKLTSHLQVFTVQLTLGDQHWEAEGTSIKKAQHAAAAKALEGTRFPKPTARPSRNEGKNPGTV